MKKDIMAVGSKALLKIADALLVLSAVSLLGGLTVMHKNAEWDDCETKVDSNGQEWIVRKGCISEESEEKFD